MPRRESSEDKERAAALAHCDGGSARAFFRRVGAREAVADGELGGVFIVEDNVAMGECVSVVVLV